ncbi:MAG TPA: PLP-dependent aminotransferase family protein [Roseomonas sp.]|jgi:DNA-binding transcriptional MocR family regulator
MQPDPTTLILRRHMEGHSGPLYLGIVEALRRAIESGDLQDGDRLPAQRQLAAVLKLDLTTVTRAFNEARHAGLLEATVGRGSFVRAGASARLWREGGRALIDMTMNLPPALGEPSLRRLVQDGIASLLRRQEVGGLMSYRSTAGTPEERAAGAAWLRPVLGKRPPAQVLVAPGAQAALLAVLSSLLRPGDVILAERYAYPGLRALAAQLGLVVAGVVMDAEGMVPEELERACRAHAPKLICCTPAIQNPTTATMSLPRREAVLAVARRHDLPVLEDDPYGLLPENPLPALARLDPGRVFHVATVSKVLSPGLRTAFLAVPDEARAERLTLALRATTMMAPGLLTGLVHQWIAGGQALELLRGVRGEMTARQAMARAVLGEAAEAHPQGLHLWLRLPPHWPSVAFAAHLQRQGLAVVPGEAFTVEGEPPLRARLALGPATDRATLRQSLDMVAAVLRQDARAYAGIV